MAELAETPLFSPSTTPREDRPYFDTETEKPLFADAQKRIQPQQKEIPLEQYKQMPWSDVLSKATGELGPSAARSLMAIPSAIYNYPETGHALKQALYGGLGAAECVAAGQTWPC